MNDRLTNDKVQDLYSTLPSGTRLEFGGNESTALAYYAEFVSYVERVVGDAGLTVADEPLLDVGCGCGWTTYSFARRGFKATGIDLNPKEFEPGPTEGLTLLEGNGMKIGFPDDSFGVVVTYQCLEHVPDPAVMLAEMLRVCRPGGIVAVVGPNLLNPLLPLSSIVHDLKRGNTKFRRMPGMARHPHGNTVGEKLIAVPRVIGQLTKKLLSDEATMTMRVPDTVPPFHGDNDACYLCNPVDLMRWFTKNGASVFQIGKFGRPKGSYLFFNGTWIAAKKQSKEIGK